MRVALGLSVVLTAMTVGTAGAQVTAEQQGAIRANCRSDFMSKCSGVTPGGKEALQCLQKNVATLSAGCKTAVTATLPEPAPAAASSAPARPAAAPKMEAAAPPPAASTPPPSPAPVTTPAAPTAAAGTGVAAKPVEATKPVQAAKPRAVARPPSSPTSAPPPAASGAKTAAVPAATASAPPAVTAPTTAPDKPAINAAVALRACKLDLVRHCGNVAFGEGRKLACLTERAENLTMRCRTALKVSAPLR